MKLLSVIVPCYNEEENVRDFYDELCKNTDFFHEKQIEFEILYVDDGSKDQTVSEVKKLHKEDGCGFAGSAFATARDVLLY